MTVRLDIWVGPVQGFIAQSRRTRDLWGSSYLLSFLSAHAMHGASQAGGTIIQPLVDKDPLYLWAAGCRDGEPPRIGSVPNHFVVKVDGDPRKIAKEAKESLDTAWGKVWKAVWDPDVERVSSVGEGTKCIWNRQVSTFWEVMWTVETADCPTNSGGLLARRKHWRSHRQPDEPGDKCTVMNDFQELSGYIRAMGGGGTQKEFWRCMRERLGRLDLRDNEQLCAISLVKRLFPKVSSKALGWEVKTAHWPSTVYVGAVPWVRQVLDIAPDTAKQYASEIGKVNPYAWAKNHTPFKGLNTSDAGRFPELDANYFHLEFVRNEGSSDDGTTGATINWKDLESRLADIYKATDKDGSELGPPSSFYALLLADGDHLGKTVANANIGGEKVGKALLAFSSNVPGVVSRHDGVTVYAGGDDVLAMLPVPQALSCASSLSKCYSDAFKGDNDKETQDSEEATLSAAIVFAHIRLSLRGVIAESHRLLDDVAKEANGRNSLAVGVMKHSGPYCQWVTTWHREHPSSKHPDDAVKLIECLRKIVKENADAADPGLASGLIYRIREMLTVLCGWNQWEPGAWGDWPAGLDLSAFLRAEILPSLMQSSDAEARKRASELGELVSKLLLQSARSPSPDEVDDKKADGVENKKVGVDALLLARFLASGEAER